MAHVSNRTRTSGNTAEESGAEAIQLSHNLDSIAIPDGALVPHDCCIDACQSFSTINAPSQKPTKTQASPCRNRS